VWSIGEIILAAEKNPEVLGKKLSQCHFVHYRYHLGSNPGLREEEVGD
jgi:hypothetical protein